jgi:branched-chain amino acid aminotransferase
MIVFLNGQFVPEEQAVVSVFDRCFLYGDGLFETMRIANGKPFRWEQHMERLERGAEVLKIRLPNSSDALRHFATQLLAKNQLPEALLRLTLSRGIGLRGYSPKSADNPSLVMSLHAAPHLDLEQLSTWNLVTASVHLPANEPLAQFKTCNKLPQIFARMESDAAGGDEALLLNTDGHIVEGASSNLFGLDDDTVCTPPLGSGILAGVTRSVVLELCRSRGLTTCEANITPEQLRLCEGVFLSLSSAGIAEASSLDGRALAQSPLVNQLRLAYWDLVARENG